MECFSVVLVLISIVFALILLLHSESVESVSLRRLKRAMTDMKSFRQEALNEHNRLRALHGSPPLKFDEKLCPFAEEWAKKIADDSEKKNAIFMTHSHKYDLGENLATCKCGNWNGTAVTKAWYDEISKHNWTNNIFNWRSGHFSQVIWAETTTMCIAYCFSSNKRFISIVAHYQPRGNANYYKSFAANVRKLKGG